MDELQQQPTSHKKIYIALSAAGILLLVIGGIIWYTGSVNNSTSLSAAPPDADYDLLSDEEEIKLGTDPQKADTDGDGLSDYLELQLKTDPKNAHSVTGNMFDGEAVLNRQLEQEAKARQERIKNLKQS